MINHMYIATIKWILIVKGKSEMLHNVSIVSCSQIAFLCGGREKGFGTLNSNFWFQRP